ncbi:hypothetical protein C8Q78DRAFT_995428 [Trametes maxima]|nr:hypothetical protein C8Q78DRAFT_995428 [Trametes maxima]
MNSTSPASPTPFARPQRVDPNTENRGSGLRASILESALELGVGTNRTVANWIFNPVPEDDEGEGTEDVNSPSLTYASTATSEESNLSAGLTQHSQPGAGILVNGKDQPLSLDTSVQDTQRSGPSPAANTPPESMHRALHFDLSATPEPRVYSPVPSPQPKSKLSKLRRKMKPDGYESDGGYVSESGKSKEKEKKGGKLFGRNKKGDGDGADESDGGYLSEVALKKKKSKKEKKEKPKSKNTESPTTENETDKGYSSSFSRNRSRKQTVTSPVSGDESDGGYLSEASSKKKRFFRLNSRSRKKDSFDSAEQAPPVPALPVLPHPIADKWSRSGTPLPESRNATPLPSDAASSLRPSGETYTSMDTYGSMDTFTTTETTTETTADTTVDSSNTVESDEKRDSLLSSDEGLTRAFRDAESVRSPSIDFLSTFRRPGGTPASPRSPLSPSVSPSKSIRSRPKISAPNTTTLAPKHVPVPLTLTPPTPTSTSHRYPPSPDPEYVLVTPSGSAPNTPHAPELPGHSSHPSVASAGTSNSKEPPSPTMQRPKVLAYYDLPPPSPPPRGPLPDVPSDISRSTSPSWSMMDQSTSRFPRSAPADSTDPRGIQQQQFRASQLTVERLSISAHPLSREIAADSTPRSPVPRIASPVPPALRGRVSPFPTAPVLPREQTTSLMRRTSKLTQEAVIRATKAGHVPASASAYPNRFSKWPSQELQLGSQWQPRSASALDTRYPADNGNGPESDDGHSSFLAYDDDDDELSDSSPARPITRPGSAGPSEPSPDVNTILAGFRAERETQLEVVKANALRESHTLSAIVAGYSEGDRDTLYLDSEEGGGDRYSVWSDAASRHSFLDNERSAAIRAKFVKRVEAMYGQDLVPPVPQLDPGLRSAATSS